MQILPHPILMEVYFMGKYEFSLRQEVLLEKGASVLGDLFRFKRQHGITDQADPISVLYGLVWSAKQERLSWSRLRANLILPTALLQRWPAV